MGHAQTRLQQRYLLFIKCGAVIAVIFLITSASAAQSTATIPPEVPWPEYLQEYPGLMAEFGQLLDKLTTRSSVSVAAQPGPSITVAAGIDRLLCRVS